MPPVAGFPDPLAFMDGRKVATREQWTGGRRRELGALFEHYMYGISPPLPVKATEEVGRARDFHGGAGTLREFSLDIGPAGAPKIALMLVLPKGGRAPVFLGLNFFGNHALVRDDSVALPLHAGKMRARGEQAGSWLIERTIERGYGVATFNYHDVDPDTDDFTNGIHPHYPAEYDWGAIAAWAWGLRRTVDFLLTVPGVDGKRIAAVGHSRQGKAALLAAAFDERMAMAIPSQAGCGGTAPSRGRVGETVRQINTVFPHWFNAEFKSFNDRVERLPFDQHCLVAMMAPRPVLLANAVEDQHANPAGQFEVLKAADPVYRFLGMDGLADREMPEPGLLSAGRLGYHIRPGEHFMGPEDWAVFLDYAGRWLRA